MLSRSYSSPKSHNSDSEYVPKAFTFILKKLYKFSSGLIPDISRHLLVLVHLGALPAHVHGRGLRDDAHRPALKVTWGHGIHLTCKPANTIPSDLNILTVACYLIEFS